MKYLKTDLVTGFSTASTTPTVLSLADRPIILWSARGIGVVGAVGACWLGIIPGTIASLAILVVADVLSDVGRRKVMRELKR